MNTNGGSTSNTYSSAEAQWYQPAFASSSNCTSGLGATAYSIWAGLGGWAGQPLAQSGTDTGSGANTFYPFWEALNTAHPNAEVAWSGLYTITPGDQIDAFTRYSSGRLYFFVEDISTGVSWNTNFASYNGNTAAQYYSGREAEYITEAPGGGSAPGGFYYLRKPTAPTTFFYATPHGYSISHYNSWRLNEVGSGTGNLMQASSFDGVSNAWNNTWYNCR